MGHIRAQRAAGAWERDLFKEELAQAGIPFSEGKRDGMEGRGRIVG